MELTLKKDKIEKFLKDKKVFLDCVEYPGTSTKIVWEIEGHVIDWQECYQDNSYFAYHHIQAYGYTAKGVRGGSLRTWPEITHPFIANMIENKPGYDWMLTSSYSRIAVVLMDRSVKLFGKRGRSRDLYDAWNDPEAMLRTKCEIITLQELKSCLEN